MVLVKQCDNVTAYLAFRSLLPTKAEVNRLLAGVSEPHNSLSNVGYTHTVRLPLNVDTEQKKPYLDRSAKALARTHTRTHLPALIECMSSLMQTERFDTVCAQLTRLRLYSRSYIRS